MFNYWAQIAHLDTFLVRNCLHFMGAQVGASFSNFVRKYSQMGTQLGEQIVKLARNWVHKLFFFVRAQLC